MKRIKKLAALMMAAIMALAMSITAFAADEFKITINNSSDSVSMEGNTYTAYKLFDVTYDGDAYAYTVADSFKEFSYTPAGATEAISGYGLVEYLEKYKDNSAEVNAFATAARTYANDNSVQASGSVTATEANTATITLSSAGYYLVYGTATADEDEQVTAAVGLTTTNPNAEMTLKTDAPTIDKVIVEADSANGNDGKGTAQDVGSTVNFKLTSTVPKMVGYDKYTYTVQDTMSAGLTFDADSVKVTVGGTNYSAYTVKTENLGNHTFEIEFDPTEFVQLTAGAEIVITYGATLNEGALSTDVETNTVNLKYSNNPYDDGTGETPDRKVYVYDFDIDIDKYVEDQETEKLADAKFVLRKEGTNDYYFVNTTGQTVSWVTLNDDADETIAAAITAGTITEVTTDENGFASFKGLDSGKYELVETAAPDGYNKLGEAVKVEITATYKDNGEIDTTNTEKQDNGQYHIISKIANATGSLLPSTGGIGTTIFYIVGAILVIGAGILLVTKKRMARE